MGADTGDGNVGVLKGEGHLLLIGHVLEFEVGLIAEIRRRLDLLEPVVPRTGLLTIGEDDLGADTCQGARRRHTEGTRCTENGRVDPAVRVALAFIIDMQAL